MILLLLRISLGYIQSIMYSDPAIGNVFSIFHQYQVLTWKEKNRKEN